MSNDRPQFAGPDGKTNPGQRKSEKSAEDGGSHLPGDGRQELSDEEIKEEAGSGGKQQDSGPAWKDIRTNGRDPGEEQTQREGDAEQKNDQIFTRGHLKARVEDGGCSQDDQQKHTGLQQRMTRQSQPACRIGLSGIHRRQR